MTTEASELAKALQSKSRLALSKAITLVESTRSDHRKVADDLITQITPSTGQSIRIAISGPPGVGKSSFIEALGLFLVGLGKKLAVLAIDPSSPITGGSILGDRTRMEELSRSDLCYIRPSPSRGNLGGVERHTRKSILLCEAAGFEIILIETVGVGQSEFMAASMTDFFIQLHQPSSGDELQGVKKGILELADFICVSKADGDHLKSAEAAKLDLTRAISLTHDHQREPAVVHLISSHQKTGIKEFWDHLTVVLKTRKDSGVFEQRRATQSFSWFQEELEQEVLSFFKEHPQYSKLLEQVKQNAPRTPITHSREFVTKLLSYKD